MQHRVTHAAALVFLAASAFRPPGAGAAQPKLKAAPPMLRLPDNTKGAKISPDARTAAEAGIAAFTKGDLETARKQFQKLLTLAPENLTGLVNLGSVEFRLEHFDEARKLLQRAVRINPDAGQAWLILGMCEQRQEKLDESLAALSQAAVLEPKNPRCHSALAVTLAAKNWLSGAEDELQRALALDPDDAESHFNLALLYLQRTPPAIELARRHYQKARDLGAGADAQIEAQLNAATE